LAGDDLTALPDEQVLRRMARHLAARREHPVGTVLWAQAVLGYEECARELSRRAHDQVMEALRERGEDPDAL
jgi:hypothetical protein